MARTKKQENNSPTKSEKIDTPKKRNEDSSSDISDSDEDERPVSEHNNSDFENQLEIDESSNDSVGMMNRANASVVFEKYPVSLKLELLRKVRAVNKRHTCSVARTLKLLDWSLIKIDGYTKEQLQECLQSILGMISTRRTFEEMLTVYEKDFKKIELKISKSVPKRPLNPTLRYIADNREMLKKLCMKENPKQNPVLTDVNTLGTKYFKTVLSPEEREKYQQEYKVALAKYNDEMNKFIEEHPEFATGRKEKAIKRKERQEEMKKLKAEKKEEKKVEKRKRKLKSDDVNAELTPFRIFKLELEKEGRNMPYKDAFKMYTVLDDREKFKYIKKLSELETDRDKRFTKKEEKILFDSKGEPKKPISAYNRFISVLSKDGANRGKLLQVANEKWRALDPERKQKYQDEYEAQYEEWKRKMLEWIETQPKEERDFLRSKHHLLASKAKKRRQTVCADEPPSKKGKIEDKTAAISDSENSSSKNSKKKAVTKKSKKTVVSDDDDDSSNEMPKEKPSPKKNKKKNSDEEGSTSKEKLKNHKLPTKRVRENDSDDESENEKSMQKSPTKNDKKIDDSESPRKNDKKKDGSESPTKNDKQKEGSQSPTKEKSFLKKTMSNDSDLDSILSIKKKKFKTFISELGEFPSLTAAHYFMTKKYSGKPNKVAKAYGKLSRVEKRELLQEVNKIKMKYFEKLKEFVQNDQKYAEKIKNLHLKNKQQQEEEIRWHTSTNTDQESDTSTDSDSD